MTEGCQDPKLAGWGQCLNPPSPMHTSVNGKALPHCARTIVNDDGHFFRRLPFELPRASEIARQGWKPILPGSVVCVGVQSGRHIRAGPGKEGGSSVRATAPAATSPGPPDVDWLQPALVPTWPCWERLSSGNNSLMHDTYRGNKSRCAPFAHFRERPGQKKLRRHLEQEGGRAGHTFSTSATSGELHAGLEWEQGLAEVVRCRLAWQRTE